MIHLELEPGEAFDVGDEPLALVPVGGDGRLLVEFFGGHTRRFATFEEGTVQQARLIAEGGTVSIAAVSGPNTEVRCLRLGSRRIVGEGGSGAELFVFAAAGELVLRISGEDDPIELTRGGWVEQAAGPRGHDWELRGSGPGTIAAVFERLTDQT